MKIGMVYDLRSEYLAEGYTEEQAAEFDADVTIDAIEAAIAAAGHRPERIGHGRRLAARLVAGDRWDMVFNIAEGERGRGREAQVPCLLEMYDIPYTFSDPLVCAVTLDKAVAKRVAMSAGVRSPRFATVERIEDLAAVDLAYPLFAKPACEGTGKGIDARSRVSSPAQLHAVCSDLLERFRQAVLVEEYLPGREFTVGLLGTGRRARVLGTLEVGVAENAPSVDYGFEMKERCEEFCVYQAAAPGPLRDEVESVALAAYLALECRDAGRVDVRLDAAGRASFMEVNPLAGLNPGHSDLPMIATQQGLSFPALIAAILDSATERMVAP